MNVTIEYNRVYDLNYGASRQLRYRCVIVCVNKFKLFFIVGLIKSHHDYLHKFVH